MKHGFGQVRSSPSIYHFYLQWPTLGLAMANGLGGTRYGTCPYNTTRHEYVSVGHAAQHDTHVGRAGPKILGTRALKAQHD